MDDTAGAIRWDEPVDMLLLQDCLLATMTITQRPDGSLDIPCPLCRTQAVDFTGKARYNRALGTHHGHLVLVPCGCEVGEIRYDFHDDDLALEAAARQVTLPPGMEAPTDA